MIISLAAVVCLTTSMVAAYPETVYQQRSSDRTEEQSTFEGNWNVVYNILTECIQTDFVSCVKARAITVFERAARASDLSVVDSLSFVRNSNYREDVESGRAMSDEDFEASIPRSSGGGDSSLNGKLFASINKFLDSHTMKLDLSAIYPGAALKLTRNLKDAESMDLNLELAEQPSGRGKNDFLFGFGGKGMKKMKKYIWPLIIGIKLKYATLSAIAYKFLAAMSAKAVIVSMISIVISLVIALKKSKSSEHQTYEIVSHPQYSHSYTYDHATEGMGGGHGGGGHYGRRSLEVEAPDEEFAQNLAFRGQQARSQ